MDYRSRGRNKRLRFKIVLLGEGRVGKTSCLLRYIKNEFNDKQVSTTQVAHFEKPLNINGKSLIVNVWDTAGQEQYHALGPIYYRDADAALILYDITDKNSFSRVKVWVKELKKIVGDISIAIAGNKTDLERMRHVEREAAEKYAESVGAKHFECSAKLNKGISTVFEHLATDLVSKVSVNPAVRFGDDSGLSSEPSGRRKKRVLVLEEDGATSGGKDEDGPCC